MRPSCSSQRKCECRSANILRATTVLILSSLATSGAASKARTFAEDRGIQVVGEGHSGGIRGAFQGHSGPKKGIQEYGGT